ncbi:MAG: lytic murein transglycosylase [Acidobacteria bacterium]|nr:lytic murein transglycosylase [Acidobacteriota bacterium]
MTRVHAAIGTARSRVTVALLAVCVALPRAQEPGRPTFESWLDGVRQEALDRGIRPDTVTRAFDGLTPLEVVVERDRTQAEAVLTVDEYVRRRLTTGFVRTANEKARAERRTLARVAARYGVQPRFLVAIWGLESNFGRFSGVRPVVQALATLAWDGRRGALFKNELMYALEIVDRGDIELSVMKGSWAGAMGQTQFMPSSYLKHAEDFDGDGHRDIWGSTPDVLASIANYLGNYGWKADQTWGREVKLPRGREDHVVAQVGLRGGGCRAEREMTEPRKLVDWQALGVRTVTGGALPRVDREASLFRSGSRAWLVYANYEVLLGYNCAHAYALAVGQLADRIRR